MADIELIESVPVVNVTDVQRAVAFYRDQLGFSVLFDMGTPPYAGMTRSGMTFHLDGGTHQFSGRPNSFRFHIRGIDALYAEIEPRGIVKPDERLRTMPHGMRQFSVVDPDGNRLTFAEPVAP